MVFNHPTFDPVTPPLDDADPSGVSRISQFTWRCVEQPLGRLGIAPSNDSIEEIKQRGRVPDGYSLEIQKLSTRKHVFSLIEEIHTVFEWV